jgi:two-component system cell cycle sensor histidine kinase/response regulator CckA
VNLGLWIDKILTFLLPKKPAGKKAHDFNNILGIIMGNTELALLDCKDTNIQNTLELIYGQIVRGKNLTMNLVAFANDQEPRQEFFNINEKIDLIINLLQKDLEDIELVKEKGSDVPELLADPGMIEHALVNLIQNAIHALGFVEHPKITIRTYCLDGNICFEIEDNGCGIPKDHLEKIYDPAFTLKGGRDVTHSYKPHIKGTGYGMANIKKYIEQHNGVIAVESTFGSGTRFIISLPITEKELTPKEKIEIFKSSIEYEKSILLVEDEPAISEVQYRILTGEPCYHKVDKADNGQVAIDLFEKNKYDVVSLDYILSGDMNGMDVYHHIRKTNKEIPILFISGNIEFLESIKELRQKDDNVRHLSKPCQNKRYVSHINWLLRKTSISTKN